MSAGTLASGASTAFFSQQVHFFSLDDFAGHEIQTILEDGEQPADTYVYDPMVPVQTIGGGDCCNGGIVHPGARDQRPVQVRDDVLVYTSDVLTEPLDVTGFIDAVLYVSSDAPDTDFAVKLVDVAPDGTAWIVDDTILRARYRNGYDAPEMMEAGEVYELDFTPMTSSIVFQPGHRIQVEITSSNFSKDVSSMFEMLTVFPVPVTPVKST